MTSRRRESGAEDSGPATPIARHGRLKKHGAAPTVLKLLAAALAVVLVSGATVAGLAAWSLTAELGPGVALVGEQHVADIGAIEGGVNLLIVGSDSGGGNPAYGKRDAELNDVTMLLHLSADHSAATVVSFPRDMFVPIPSCPKKGGGSYSAMSSQKINTTLSHGGLACTVLTVQELTGLPIQFAAKIEFDGVIAMSNAVGGVPVCVATAINDRQIDFHLSAGPHTLSGHDALQFVRTRYGIGDGSDITRISNQQVFLSALARTIKSAKTLSDPLKVFNLATAAAKNMELSNSLRNVSTLASIAVALKDINLDDVVFVQYPGVIGTQHGQGGVLPLTKDAAVLFKALANDEPIGLSGTVGGGATIDPTAPTTTAPPESPAATPAPGATKAPVVELPKSITGQTAGTYTCSKGQ